jgi:ABC-type glucose/galactose transport system permease subunit
MKPWLKHILEGALVSSLALTGILILKGTDKSATDLAMLAAFVSAFLIGLAKEISDRKTTGFDVGDLTLTWSGCFVPIVVWGIIQNFV